MAREGEHLWTTANTAMLFLFVPGHVVSTIQALTQFVLLATFTAIFADEMTWALSHWS